MGLREMLQAVREYPAVRARLETAERELSQARTALEKSELECQRLSGSCSEAKHRLRFSEKKAEAQQAALAEFCPKLDSLESMLRFYETISPSLDPQGFTLYRTSKKMTKIDLHSYFAYEDSRGMFEESDGRRLLRWLTAAYFHAVDWEIVTGTCYEEAILREVDTSTPEYQAFESELYRKALERMGFGDLLAPEETIKSKEIEVTAIEGQTTELKLYSPLTAALYMGSEEFAGGKELPEILYGEDLVSYKESILNAIEDETLPELKEQGFMLFFSGSKTIGEKVLSIHPTVEELDGELHAAAVCRIKGSLTPDELAELKAFCAEEYEDSWGEDFSRRPRHTKDGELYVSFWQDDDFFIRTKEELEAAKVPVRSQPKICWGGSAR